MVAGPSPTTFVSYIKPRPILGKERTMYIIGRISEDTALSGFDHVHTEAHHLIHLDSITAKVKFVPHYDNSKQNAFMCGVSMWWVR